MKTANLTPWCNLFSTASKFNISITTSRYRQVIHFSFSALLLLLVLINFSYAYQLALTLATLTLIVIGFLLTNTKPVKVVAQLALTRQGKCSLLTMDNPELFDGFVEDLFEDNIEYFQLLSSSRFSFFGCWLVLLPVPTVALFLNENKNFKTKQLFIYRDSLSSQSFSHLIQTIKNLETLDAKC